MKNSDDRRSTDLQCLEEVADLAEVVQDLVDPRLVRLHERVKAPHVLFLSIQRLVREVLQHLCDLQQNQLKEQSLARAELTKVSVRLGCFDGTPSTSM
jgi:hypothetical protein